MPQIFHRSVNVVSRISILGAVFILLGLGWAWGRWVRSDYATNVGVAVSVAVMVCVPAVFKVA